MKSFDFECGGDYGNWECLVSVDLTDEQAEVLKEYAQNHEFLDKEPPVKDIYRQVFSALKDDCDEDANLSRVVIRVPYLMNRR